MLLNGKPLPTPIFICSPFGAILACSELWSINLGRKFCNSDYAPNYKLPKILAISRHKFRVGACEAIPWARCNDQVTLLCLALFVWIHTLHSFWSWIELRLIWFPFHSGHNRWNTAYGRREGSSRGVYAKQRIQNLCSPRSHEQGWSQAVFLRDYDLHQRWRCVYLKKLMWSSVRREWSGWEWTNNNCNYNCMNNVIDSAVEPFWMYSLNQGQLFLLYKCIPVWLFAWYIHNEVRVYCTMDALDSNCKFFIDSMIISLLLTSFLFQPFLRDLALCVQLSDLNLNEAYKTCCLSLV